jgi:hypothetical protein
MTDPYAEMVAQREELAKIEQALILAVTVGVPCEFYPEECKTILAEFTRLRQQINNASVYYMWKWP